MNAVEIYYISTQKCLLFFFFFFKKDGISKLVKLIS